MDKQQKVCFNRVKNAILYITILLLFLHLDITQPGKIVGKKNHELSQGFVFPPSTPCLRLVIWVENTKSLLLSSQYVPEV